MFSMLSTYLAILSFPFLRSWICFYDTDITFGIFKSSLALLYGYNAICFITIPVLMSEHSHKVLGGGVSRFCRMALEVRVAAAQCIHI